jgi:hypothetical protein
VDRIRSCACDSPSGSAFTFRQRVNCHRLFPTSPQEVDWVHQSLEIAFQSPEIVGASHSNRFARGGSRSCLQARPGFPHWRSRPRPLPQGPYRGWHSAGGGFLSNCPRVRAPPPPPHPGRPVKAGRPLCFTVFHNTNHRMFHTMQQRKRTRISLTVNVISRMPRETITVKHRVSHNERTINQRTGRSRSTQI